MDIWNADDPAGYGWIFKGRGEWYSNQWNVFGMNGPSTLERDSTECDARRLDPWLDRHGDKVGSVGTKGVVHLGSPTGILLMVSGAGRSGCVH
jgi:hypothetical protein